MAEYIDRHEAVVVVSRPALTRAELRRFICQIPAADVVEVVRCKDCVFWYVPKLANGEKLGACGWWSGNALVRSTRAEDYCSRGERKEDKA